MEIIIKIPGKHREFLKEKGTLDFFVEAVKLGKNELAKWTLLESSKNELKKIMRRKTTQQLTKCDDDISKPEINSSLIDLNKSTNFKNIRKTKTNINILSSEIFNKTLKSFPNTSNKGFLEDKDLTPPKHHEYPDLPALKAEKAALYHKNFDIKNIK